MKKHFVLLVALVVALMVSALVTAQDDTTPYLGIGVDSADNGALITAIQPDSPAALAGLQEGDIITAVNDTEVSADNLAETIRGLAIGDTVTLSVLRDSDTVEIQAELAARPAPAEAPDADVQIFQDRPYLGVSLDDGDNGVVIREVAADSPAAAADLQVDDVIVSINGTQVENARAAVEAIRGLKTGDQVSLEIQRSDDTMTVEVTLGSMMSDGRFVLPEGAQSFDIVVYNSADQGWEIFGLSEDNALAQAGLQRGDVIKQIDGATYTPETLSAYLDGLADDANVALTIERDGETQDFTVPATALDALTMFNFGFEGLPGRPGMSTLPDMMSGVRLGVAFNMVDDGAQITEVVADSPAAEAGLQVDDIVTAVGGDVVDQERTLSDRLMAYEPGDTVTLSVKRGDDTLSLDVTLGEFSMGEMPFFGGEHDLFNMLPHLFGPDGELPFNLHQPAQPAKPAV